MSKVLKLQKLTAAPDYLDALSITSCDQSSCGGVCGT